VEREDPSFASPDLAEARFAANLRILRERRRMSQEKLAQEMLARGWPWRQQTVTKIENGQRMVRFGEAIALASILGESLDHFTRPGSEAIEVEKIRAASARLRESYEAVAAAVCHLLDERRTAERLRVLNDQVQGGDLVEIAMVELRHRMRECSVDKGVLEGRRRVTELGEKRSGGEEGGAGPAPEDAREPTPGPEDQAEPVGAPGHAGSA
jgi:transcriptional regulator with XRE-family HTH domain